MMNTPDEAEHTPGPWLYERGLRGYQINSGAMAVAVVPFTDGAADAALIAEAPPCPRRHLKSPEEGMSAHTKEPWRAENDEVFAGDNDRPIAHILSTPFEDDANSGMLVSSDARRIAACVNACRGYSTRDLECDGNLLGTMRRVRDALKQQIDAMPHEQPEQH